MSNRTINVDHIVLGAGIIGICIAIHLRKLGKSVVLVDKQEPGKETSFGNSGLIQREGVFPYAIPRELKEVYRFIRNRSIDVRYDAKAIVGMSRFFGAYWHHSQAERHALLAEQYSTLIEHCVAEHRALADEAGVRNLIRSTGWIKLFRDPVTAASHRRQADLLNQEYGVNFDYLDRVSLGDLEPALTGLLEGGLHYTDADSVSDPGALVTGYFEYFLRLGGEFVVGDAASLRTEGEFWTIDSGKGKLLGPLTVALGPWAFEIAKKLGYNLNVGIKRGYHMHYVPGSEITLVRPVLDVDNGYMLVPTARGIRLTTGAEFAYFDAPKNMIQLDRAEPIARKLLPLKGRLDSEPWLGRRPCTPDMLPIIGPAPGHRNLWFAFGHAHHGLTLGPITGRVVAEAIVGRPTLVNLAPFRVDRPSIN